MSGYLDSLETLRARVVARPWQLVGGAALLGAWLGLDQPRVPHNRVARAAFALVGAIALRAVRDVALREVLAAIVTNGHPHDEGAANRPDAR